MVFRQLGLDSFNARDLDGVLSAVHDDVLWANGLDGGHLRGKHAVREYWSRQWAQVSPRVEPLSFAMRNGTEIAVRVRQDLRDLSGRPLANAGGLQSREVGHVYRFEAGKVARFDIDEDV